MDLKTLVVSVSVAGAAVLGGALYVGVQIAEANHAMRTPAPPPPPLPAAPAEPPLDPAYVAGTIEIASKMGVTVSELRRRYQVGAEACKTTPEGFWGQHVRAMRRWEAAEALDMEIQYCRIKGQ